MVRSPSARRYAFGTFTIDVGRRALYDESASLVEIPAQAFDALVYFVGRPGVVIERAELMEALWPDAVVEDNSLSRTILRVRRVLGDGYIVTVKGRGYQFVADVRPADEMPSALPRRNDAPLGEWSPAARLALAGALGGLVVLALLVLASDNGIDPTPNPDTRYSEVPTSNSRALEFYLSGRRYERMHNDWDPELAARQYQRAVELAPDFALAWARLSIVHNEIFWFRGDVSRARRILARDAARRAIELDPDLSDARMALGWYQYHIEEDPEAAISELEHAAAAVPGDGEVHWRLGIVHRRYGDFERALAEFETLAALRPFEPDWLADAVEIELVLRRYSEADKLCDRLLEVAPDDSKALTYRALIPLYRDGDAELAAVAATDRTLDVRTPWVIPPAIMRWLAAIFMRDFDGALRALDTWSGEAWRDTRRYVSKAGLRASTLELAGRDIEARETWREALAHVGAVLDQNPDYPEAWMARAEVLARSNDPTMAVSEALRVIRYFEATGDLMSAGEHRIDAVRRVFLPAGALDEAIVSLETYLKGPGFWSLEGLLADPRLDPLRDDPRLIGLRERFRSERASR